MTRVLNRKNEVLVDVITYRYIKQSYENPRVDACCGCVARWSMKLCDVIGSCKPGWVYVEKGDV